MKGQTQKISKSKDKGRKGTPTIENYYALLAVILNENLSIDQSIRYFDL